MLPQAHRNRSLSGASARLVPTRPGWTLGPRLMLHHLPCTEQWPGDSSSILKQLRATELRPQGRVLPQVTKVYGNSWIHLLSHKTGRRKSLLLKNNNNKKSAQVLQNKTACHTWNVIKAGFQWEHGRPPHASHHNDPREKQKWWVGEETRSVIPENSLQEKKILKKWNIHVSYLQSPPTTIILF